MPGTQSGLLLLELSPTFDSFSVCVSASLSDCDCDSASQWQMYSVAAFCFSVAKGCLWRGLLFGLGIVSLGFYSSADGDMLSTCHH